MGRLIYLDEGSITRCGIDSVNGTFSTVDSRYRLIGTCNVFDSANVPGKTSTFDAEKLQYVLKWDADGIYVPTTKETREVITVYRTIRTGPDRTGSTFMGKVTNNMICAKDPWRESADGACGAIQTDMQLKHPEDGMKELSVKDKINVPRTSLLSAEQRAALNQRYEKMLAIEKGIRQKPAEKTARRDNPAIGHSYVPVAGAGATLKAPVAQMSVKTCQQGFVWRLARPTDYVCVTPASRTRSANENAAANSLRDPKGAYGPNTCVNGYVWREAFAGDVVCVKPEIRTLVRQENLEGPKHAAP
ncbi:MAG TPA: hypothetical protein VJS66_03950 [Burkholderiales bacterium]|nr:hypothetical protein [Burkholderiales bacterium]